MMEDNPKSKGVAALLVSKMGPKEGEQEESGDDEGLNAAAEDILAAIASKDPQSLKMALKSFWEMA